MITGFEALKSIEDALAMVRDDEMRLDAALRSASEEAARLRHDRLEELHALAQLKFRLIQRGELVEDLDAAERRVKELLDRAHREMSEAADKRQQAADALRAAVAARNERAAAHEAATTELRAFEDALTPGVAADPAFVALKEGCETVEKMWREADKKAAQAEADRERKKTPYETDPLFMYLWRRKFGAADYASGFLARYFDERVAGLIGYADARRNYAMLNQIPQLLREHADRLGAEFESRSRQLGAFRHEKLVAAGAGPLQDKAAKAEAALDACEGEVATASKKLETLDRAYDAAAGQNTQSAFAQAIDLMVENDSRDDVVTLYREAARTKTDENRAIVERIDRLTRAIAHAEEETAQMRNQIREVAARRAELRHARDEFRHRGYDYPGATFGNEVTINDVLGGILDGVVKGAVLGQVLQQGYRRPPSSDWGGGPPQEPMFPPDAPPRYDDGGGGDSEGGEDFHTGGTF